MGKTFSEEAYPLRNQREAFISLLQRRVWRDWNRISKVHGRWPGGSRVTYSRGEVRRDTVPTQFDRERVQALLRAWRREISDRYLDLALVRRFESPHYPTIRRAYSAIRANYPTGAVSFIYSELENHRTPYFIGPQLFRDWTYNTYFDYLLAWNDRHCYGLLTELTLQEGRYGLGGGNSIHPVWQGARNWLFLNRDDGVYRSFGIPNHQPIWDR